MCQSRGDTGASVKNNMTQVPRCLQSLLVSSAAFLPCNVSQMSIGTSSLTLLVPVTDQNDMRDHCNYLVCCCKCLQPSSPWPPMVPPAGCFPHMSLILQLACPPPLDPPFSSAIHTSSSCSLTAGSPPLLTPHTCLGRLK